MGGWDKREGGEKWVEVVMGRDKRSEARGMGGLRKGGRERGREVGRG